MDEDIKEYVDSITVHENDRPKLLSVVSSVFNAPCNIRLTLLIC